jgi:hypothetical protein
VSPRMAKFQVSGILGIRAAPGKTALATSLANQLSPFTKALVSHIDAKGRDFGELFTKITTDVLIDTDSAQRPHFVTWSSTQLYLDPTPEILGTCTRVNGWQRSMTGLAGRRHQICAQSRRQSLCLSRTRLAETAPHSAKATQYSALSPAGVDRGMGPRPARSIEVTPVGQGFVFDRSVDVRLTPAVANSDERGDRNRKAMASAGSTARLNASLATALAPRGRGGQSRVHRSSAAPDTQASSHIAWRGVPRSTL